MQNNNLIRAYLRKELENLRDKNLFTNNEITAELNRRDEILEKRRDHLHYPELGVFFR